LHARRVNLKLPKALPKLLWRTHRLSLRMTVKVKDRAGHSRTVKKTVRRRRVAANICASSKRSETCRGPDDRSAGLPTSAADVSSRFHRGVLV
jgi:hypothetical protein